MKWLLTLITGLIIAWVILFFIGPRPIVSYYTQAPVQPTELSDIEKIMEAVGLRPSGSDASVQEIVIMSPAPAPLSVADVAIADEQFVVPDDLDTQTIPQPVSPAPGPAPSIQ